MRYLAILATLFFSGCATTARYQAMMDTWLGDSSEHLVSAWGAPDSSTTLPNGKTAYGYNRVFGASATVWGARIDSCKTTFITDVSGKIIEYEFAGNSCLSHFKPRRETAASQKAKEDKENAALDHEISEYKKAHSNLDWQWKDSDGQNLELIIVRFALKHKIATFSQAADILVDLKKSTAKR